MASPAGMRDGKAAKVVYVQGGDVFDAIVAMSNPAHPQHAVYQAQIGPLLTPTAPSPRMPSDSRSQPRSRSQSRSSRRHRHHRQSHTHPRSPRPSRTHPASPAVMGASSWAPASAVMGASAAPGASLASDRDPASTGTGTGTGTATRTTTCTASSSGLPHPPASPTMRTPRQRMGIQSSEEHPASQPTTRSTGLSTAGHPTQRTTESSAFHTIESSIATLPPPREGPAAQGGGSSSQRKSKRHHRPQSRPESSRSSKSKPSSRSRRSDGSRHHGPDHEGDLRHHKSNSSVRRSLKVVADWQGRNAALTSRSSLDVSSDGPESSPQPEASSGSHFGSTLPAEIPAKHLSRDSARSTLHKTGSGAPREPADPSQATAVAQAKCKAQDVQKSKTAQGARQPSPPLVRPVAHKAQASTVSAPILDQGVARSSVREARNQHASSYSATFGTGLPQATQTPRSPSVPSDMKGSPPSLRSVRRLTAQSSLKASGVAQGPAGEDTISLPTPDLIPGHSSLAQRRRALSNRSMSTRASLRSSSSHLLERDDSSHVDPTSGRDADAESTTGTESINPSNSSAIAAARPGGEDTWSLAPSLPRNMTYDEQQRIFVIAPPPPRAPRLPPPTASGPLRKQTGPAKALPVHHTDSAPSVSSLPNVPGSSSTPVVSTNGANNWASAPSPGWNNNLHPKSSHARLTSAEQRSLLATNEYHIPSRLGPGAGPALSVPSLAGTLPGVSSSVSVLPGATGMRRRGSAPGGPKMVQSHPPRPASASAWRSMSSNVNPPVHGAGAKVAELGAKLHILSRYPKSAGHDGPAPRAGWDPDNGYVIINSPTGGDLVDTRSMLSQERKQQARVHLVPPIRRASAPPAGGPSEDDLVEDLAESDAPAPQPPAWSSNSAQPTAAERLLAAYRAGLPLPSDSAHSLVPSDPAMSDTARAAAADVAAHSQLNTPDGQALMSVFEDSDSVVSDALTDVVGASSVHGQAFGFCGPNGAWKQSLLAGLCKPAPPSQAPAPQSRSRLGMRPRPASALGISSDRKSDKPKLSNLVGLRKPRTKAPPPSASAAAAAVATTPPSASMFAAATGNVPVPEPAPQRKMSRRRSYSASILDVVRRPGSATGSRSGSGSASTGQQSEAAGPTRTPARPGSRLSSKVASLVGSRRTSQAPSNAASAQTSQHVSAGSHLSPSAASHNTPSVRSGPVPSNAAAMHETVVTSSDRKPSEETPAVATIERAAPVVAPKESMELRPMSLNSPIPADPRHLSSLSALLPPPPSPAQPDSPTVPIALGVAPYAGPGLETPRAATIPPLSPVPSSRYGNQGTAESSAGGYSTAMEPATLSEPRNQSLVYPDAPFGTTNITNASSLVPPPDSLQGLAPRPRRSTTATASQLASSQEGSMPSGSASTAGSAPSQEQASAPDRPRSTRASIGSARAAVVAAALAREVASLADSASASRDGPRSSPTRGTDERDQVEELTPAALRLLEEVSLKDRRSSLASSLVSAAVARPGSQASEGSSSAWSYALRMRSSHEPLSAVSSQNRTSCDSRHSLSGSQSRPRSRALALTAPQAPFGPRSTSFASFDEEILNSAANSEAELVPSPVPSSRRIRHPSRNRDSFFYPAEALVAAAVASHPSSVRTSSRQHHSSLPSSARESRGRDSVYWSSERGGDQVSTTPGALSQRSSLISGSTDWEMALSDPDADERVVSAEELTSRASTPLASGSASTGVPPSPSGSMGSYGAGAFRWDTMSNNAEMGASLAGSVVGSIAGHARINSTEVMEAVVSLEGVEGVVSLEGVGEPEVSVEHDSEPDGGETTVMPTAVSGTIPRTDFYNLAALTQSTGGFSAVTALSNPNDYLTRPVTAWSDELSMSDSERVASPSPFYSAESLPRYSPSHAPRWTPAALGAPPRSSNHLRPQSHSDSARQLLAEVAPARLTPKRATPYLNLAAAMNGETMPSVAEVSSAVGSPLSSSHMAPNTPRSSFHSHARASSEGSASLLADAQQDTLRGPMLSQLAEAAPQVEPVIANEPPKASVAERPATEMARRRPALLPLTLSSRATSPVTGSGRASSSALAGTSSPPSTMETRRRQAQSALDQRSLDAMQARPLGSRMRSPTPAWGASALGGRSSRASMPVSARSASRASSTEDEADTLASRMAEWYGTGAYVFQKRQARELRRQTGSGLAGLRYHRSTEPDSATSDGGPASRTCGYQSDIVGSARTDRSSSAGPLSKRYSLQQGQRTTAPSRRWSALSQTTSATPFSGSPAKDRAPSANMFAHAMTSAARRASLLPQRARSATPAGGSGGRASVSSAGSAKGGLLPLTLIEGTTPLQQALSQSLLTHNVRRHRLSLSLPQQGQLSAQGAAPTSSTALSPTPAILSESEAFSATPATTPTHSMRPTSGPLTGHASIGSIASLSSGTPAPIAAGKLSPITTMLPSPTPGVAGTRISAPPSAWRAPRDEPSKASPTPPAPTIGVVGKGDAETVTGSPLVSSAPAPSPAPGSSTPSGPGMALATEPAAPLAVQRRQSRTERQVRRASLPYIPSV